METYVPNDIFKHLRLLFLKEDVENTSFQDLTRFFPAIFYVIEAEPKQLRFVNEHRVSEVLGFTSTDISSWNSDLSQLIFKDDLELVLQELEKYSQLQDEDEHCYKCRLNHKKGDWRYFKTRGTVLRRNKEGKPASILFMTEDISETTRYQEEVDALKSLIDDTEDLLQFGSWSWDESIDKVYWTDGMYKLLGYEKEAVQPEISMGFYLKHVAKTDVAGFEEVLGKAKREKKDFEHTYTVVTNSGAEKIVSTLGKAVVNKAGELVKILGTTRDITKQVKTNSDLVHYKEMIHHKEEFFNQGSWETNIQTGETIWSKGMYRLFGYDAEGDARLLSITNELHLSHMSEEEAQRARKDWEKILKGGDDMYTREATITTIDGVSKKLETFGKIFLDKNGKVEKVVGTTRDVSRMRDYERSLEEKIQELNRSNTELEEFAYVASHDLQEPLRKLTTFSERLQTKFSEALGKDGMLYLNRIAAATENMRVLIENLLEFSRTARSSKHFTNQDVGRLLAEVEADLELKIEESGTQIVSGTLPTMEVIPSQIKQLFDNLISNSIKFRKPEQSPVIKISSDKLSPSEKSLFHLRQDKIFYKLIFEDNGIGFEKEYSERIFQIFQRLHGKAEYPGSGIGLAICKKIVENHNGIIFSDSELGTGAVFTIILPENQL